MQAHNYVCFAVQCAHRFGVLVTHAHAAITNPVVRTILESTAAWWLRLLVLPNVLCAVKAKVICAEAKTAVGQSNPPDMATSRL